VGLALEDGDADFLKKKKRAELAHSNICFFAFISLCKLLTHLTKMT
jgi:hypothetical protein